MMVRGQSMPRILLRHFRGKASRRSMSADVILHISVPYRRTEVTKLLRILSLVCLLYLFDLQTGFRVEYALLAIDSLRVMSSCDPPAS